MSSSVDKHVVYKQNVVFEGFCRVEQCNMKGLGLLNMNGRKDVEHALVSTIREVWNQNFRGKVFGSEPFLRYSFTEPKKFTFYVEGEVLEDLAAEVELVKQRLSYALLHTMKQYDSSANGNDIYLSHKVLGKVECGRYGWVVEKHWWPEWQFIRK